MRETGRGRRLVRLEEGPLDPERLRLLDVADSSRTAAESKCCDSELARDQTWRLRVYITFLGFIESDHQASTLSTASVLRTFKESKSRIVWAEPFAYSQVTLQVLDSKWIVVGLSKMTLPRLSQ